MNNPENNPLKVIIIVLVLVVAGYFVYKNMNSGNEGRVFRPSSSAGTSTTAIPGVSGGANSVTVGGITLVTGQPSPAKAVCKPGDYQGANGGCFHVKADCSFTYDDKACPTDLGSSVRNSTSGVENRMTQ